MRFYRIAGLCAFSLAVAAVCAVKKLKEKKHEAEETHGVYRKTVQEQETGQPADIPAESAEEEPEQELQESVINLEEDIKSILEEVRLHDEKAQVQQPEENTSVDEEGKMLETIKIVLSDDTIGRKEKHDFLDMILGKFAENTPGFRFQKRKFNIKRTDYELITPEICIAYIYYYVSEYAYCFENIPGVMAGAEICEYAFHVNQSVIRYIPVDCITDEMLKKVSSSRDGFFMIPEQIRSEKICRMALLGAIGNSEELLRVLKEIPAPHMNRDMMLLYLKCGGLINHEFGWITLPDGWEKWIPESVSERIAFEDKPANLRTADDYIEACKKGKILLSSVPETINLTYEQYKDICSSNGIALQSVPQKLRDAELCLAAVRNNGLALKSVPQSLRTEEICTEAIRNNYEAFSKIPKRLKENPDSFQWFAEELITASWIKEHYINDNIQDFILCRINENQFETWMINLTEVKEKNSSHIIESVIEKLKSHHKEYFIAEQLKEKIWICRRNQYISDVYAGECWYIGDNMEYWENGIFSETEVKEKIAHDYDLCLAMAKRADFSLIPAEMQTHEIISAMLHSDKKKAEKYVPAEVLKAFYHI